MKISFAIVMLSLSLSTAAHAKGSKCEFNLNDTSTTVVGVGETKAQAQANALEKCVEQRTVHFEKHRGDIDEDRFAAMIDSCSVLTCAK